MPNHPTEVTELARVQVNASDEIIVQLVRPADMPTAERTPNPAVVQILWPLQPTWVTPQRFPDTAAMLTRFFAESATTLAAIKTSRKL